MSKIYCVLFFLPWDPISYNEYCFLFTNSFQRERILLLRKLFFPQISQNFFFSLINESIMIFNKSCAVSYSCLFFQESLSQMKTAWLWEKSMSLRWTFNGSTCHRYLKMCFEINWYVYPFFKWLRINTDLRTVLKVLKCKKFQVVILDYSCIPS